MMFNRFTYLLITMVISTQTLATNNLETHHHVKTHNINEVMNQFELVGTGTFSVLFWDLYQGKLLSTSGGYPVNFEKEQLIYQIDYFVNISQDELIKRTIEQWQHLAIKQDKYEKYLSQLEQIWPNVNENDQLLLMVQQGRSAFYFNQQYIGEIDSHEFGQMFIDIWLSEKTSQPKFRQALLGKGALEIGANSND